MMSSEDKGVITGYSYHWYDYMITCHKCQNQLFCIEEGIPRFYCRKCDIFYRGKEGTENVDTKQPIGGVYEP